MAEDLDQLIDNTRRRVEEMRRMAVETARLLGETKKAEEQLDEPTARIQDRQAKEE